MDAPPDDKALPLDPAIAACLRLIETRGWFGFALRDVATEAGLGLADLYRRYPSRLALLRAWLAGIDRALLEAGVGAGDDPVRDRLFDVMMRRFDLMRPQRAALQRLRRDLRRDPLTALALAAAVDRAMTAVLVAAGLGSEGLPGALRRSGLLAIEARAVAVFCDDDSLDLGKTMVALDRELKAAERRMQGLRRLCRRPAGREAAVQDAAGEPSPDSMPQ